jgi:Putative Ig domain
MERRNALSWMAAIALVVGGTVGLRGGSEAIAATSANRVPQIFGSPVQTVLQNTEYLFEPQSSDSDGHTLSFSITNKPDWAEFSKTTGMLSGTPSASDVGTYTGIEIAVSDGRATSSLPAFEITVAQAGSESVTLAWLPPTRNDYGTALHDLAGYRIYVGQSATTLNRVIELNNAGLTRYTVDNLTPGRWYFAVTSMNASGRESQRSAIFSKEVG